MLDLAARPETSPAMTDDEAAAAIAAVVAQVRRNLPTFTYAAQNHSSVDNFYPAVANEQWTAGFWPGSIWLAYEATGDKVLRYAAQIHVQSFLNRIEKRIETDHHDMGFLYSPSCVAAWKLVGDEDGRRAGLLAADQLLDRFQEKGQFIQAWGPMGEPGNYRYIIDCLMNLPLLYLGERRDRRSAAIARRRWPTPTPHSPTRSAPDHSTYHTFYMDPATGAPVRGATTQGYRDESAWTRGQAWGIAGMAVCYRNEPNPAYLEAFEKLLAYYLKHLPDDLVPYWDLTFTSGESRATPRPPRSSPAACWRWPDWSVRRAPPRCASWRGACWAACGESMLCATRLCPTAWSYTAPTPRRSPFNSCTRRGRRRMRRPGATTTTSRV